MSDGVRNATKQELDEIAARFGISPTVYRLSLLRTGECAERERACNIVPPAGVAHDIVQPPASAHRVRQEHKPLLNKLESDYHALLKVMHPTVHWRLQARRYRLANGVWYKPDITGLVDGREVAYECKGPKEVKGCSKGIAIAKIAAHEWPEVRFVLIWREAGQWFDQELLP